MYSEQLQDGSGAAVRNLQRYLRQLSYGDTSITAPPIDGIFGSETEQALRDFQRAYGLNETGSADEETWNRLYDAYRASLAEAEPPVPVALFPQPTAWRKSPHFSAGDEGFTVAAIQYMLRELSYDCDALEDVPVDGVFGDKTVAAVRAFETLCGLKGDGDVTLPVWNALADRYNALFRRGAPS